MSHLFTLTVSFALKQGLFKPSNTLQSSAYEHVRFNSFLEKDILPRMAGDKRIGV